jgi:hypothetical protein
LGNTISGTDELGLMQVPAGTIEKAADEGIRFLTDGEYRTKVTEKNCEIAKKHYSMPALHEYLSSLMAQFDD